MPKNDSFNVRFNVALPEKDSADSIQKIIQFNSQGIIGTGRIKCPKIPKKVSKIDFSSKWQISIQNMIHSFFSQQNSIQMIIQYQLFQEYSITKLFNNLFFPENSIQILIQKSKFGFIQFNKIFIQLENQGIEHH